MNNKVSVGITSIVGWLSALAALSPAVVKAVETGQADWNGPEKYLAIFGIASGLITQVARYLQAHKLIGTTIVNDIDKGIGEFDGIISEMNKLPIAPQPTTGEVPRDNSILAPVSGVQNG